MAMNFGFSPAGQALGLGGAGDGTGNLGSDLMNQVAGETDEERRKRLQQMQQARLMGLSPTASSAAGSSPAGSALGLGFSSSMTSTGLLR